MKRGRFTGEPIIGSSWKFKALITADRMVPRCPYSGRANATAQRHKLSSGVGVCLPAARTLLGLKQKHQSLRPSSDDRGLWCSVKSLEK